jgi:signal transduction histidine kinase
MVLVAAIVAAILWTEMTTWQHIRRVKDRTEEVDFERFHDSAQLEVKFRALHDAILHEPNHSALERNRSRISECRDDLAAAYAQSLQMASSLHESDSLQRVGTFLHRYLEQVNSMLSEEPGTHEASRLPAWEGPLSGEIIRTLHQLAIDERTALKEHFSESQLGARSLHQHFVFSSISLTVLGGSLALLINRRIVAPLQQRLLHSQSAIERQEKLSSLGVLAAGVAHEIRNPLTSIKVRLFTQQQLLNPGSEEWEDNLFLADEISRLEKIVKDFLAFARPADPELVEIRASQPMQDLLPLVTPLLNKSGITIEQEYLENPWVRADAAQLKQTLLNLTKNALEAMPAGGILRLRTRLQPARSSTSPHGVVILEISDTGLGMPPEIQKRLFDPFFTTKAGGTGLGLSIASRIIEKHGGSLEFTTEVGIGTTFRILLPVVHP